MLAPGRLRPQSAKSSGYQGHATPYDADAADTLKRRHHGEERRDAAVHVRHANEHSVAALGPRMPSAVARHSNNAWPVPETRDHDADRAELGQLEKERELYYARGDVLLALQVSPLPTSSLRVGGY